MSWYEPFDGWYDLVYMSKVFSFTPDYDYVINATEIRKGGSGYCIEMVNGKEEAVTALKWSTERRCFIRKEMSNSHVKLNTYILITQSIRH